MLPICKISVLLDQKLRLSSGHFGLLLSLNQKGKKRDNLLTGIIDLNYQEEIRLATAHGVKEDCVWNQGDSVGFLVDYHS